MEGGRQPPEFEPPALTQDAERDRNRQTGMVLRHLHDRQRESDGRIARLESLLYGPSKVLPDVVTLALSELPAEGERAALPVCLCLVTAVR